MTLPFHLLTKPQTRMWLLMPGVRRVMAADLPRLYPGGCAVLAWSWSLPAHVATVDPKGRVHDQPKPYRRYTHAEITNKPLAPECPCADLFHPEYGEWRHHPDYAKGEHHPFCQFDKTSDVVYREIMVKASGGETHPELGKVRRIPLRPDEYDRARERAQGQRGEKTGARIA